MGRKLGQHFLRDHNILRKIVECAGVGKEDVVLEIGAGDGALTSYLLMKSGKVIANEIDPYLYNKLKERFRFSENFILLKGDFLKLDFYTNLIERPTKVVANIPYYLTTPLIFKLLLHHEIKDIYLTLQKEYAERLVAKPRTKQYGAITVTVSVLAEPEIKFYISRNSFTPSPKVNSALVHLRRRDVPLIPHENFPEFSSFIRAVFSQRRKILKNILKNLKKECSIPEEMEGKRPEELSVEEWVELFNTLRK